MLGDDEIRRLVMTAMTNLRLLDTPTVGITDWADRTAIVSRVVKEVMRISLVHWTAKDLRRVVVAANDMIRLLILGDSP